MRSGGQPRPSGRRVSCLVRFRPICRLVTSSMILTLNLLQTVNKTVDGPFAAYYYIQFETLQSSAWRTSTQTNSHVVFDQHSLCVGYSICWARRFRSRSEVIAAMLWKSDVFRDVTPWLWANRCRRFDRLCCVHLQCQAILDCTAISRNVGNDSPKDTASHPMKLESSSLFRL